jgi:hypothetical protein
MTLISCAPSNIYMPSSTWTTRNSAGTWCHLLNCVEPSRQNHQATDAALFSLSIDLSYPTTGWATYSAAMDQLVAYCYPVSGNGKRRSQLHHDIWMSLDSITLARMIAHCAFGAFTQPPSPRTSLFKTHKPFNYTILPVGAVLGYHALTKGKHYRVILLHKSNKPEHHYITTLPYWNYLWQQRRCFTITSFKEDLEFPVCSRRIKSLQRQSRVIEIAKPIIDNS